MYICLAAVHKVRALAIKAELIHSYVIWVERYPEFGGNIFVHPKL
jgi:hypothetical protein